MSARNLQSLLAWSTANTPASSDTPPPARQPTSRLDPAILDTILGKTDAVRMRECVAFVGETANPLADRMTAWDELEMILESLDNANDLQPLGLWPKIVAHLSSTEDETVVQALWVCGTAINNNPKAKEDVGLTICAALGSIKPIVAQFLRHDPLPAMVSLLRSSSADVRSKALYALGALLKHDDASLKRFGELGGWTGLESSLRDPSLPCRRKAAFLVGALMVDESTLATTKEAIDSSSSILSALVASLSPTTAQPTGPNGDGNGFDEDVAESSLRALRSMNMASLKEADRQAISQAVRDPAANFGLTESEKADVLIELDVPP